LLLIADDYGLAPGVNRAIRTLAERGRLSGTSVMTMTPAFAPPEIEALDAVRRPGFGLGLHLTLTGPFRPLTGRALAGPDGRFPNLARRMLQAYRGRLDRKAVEAEVNAQFEAFRRVAGRPPTHVDGHQHVHLLPVVRDVVIDATIAHAPFAWVRQCGDERTMSLSLTHAKAALIGALSRGLVERLDKVGLATNPSFSGAYAHRAGADFARQFPRFLDRHVDGGVVMVHPGHVDGVLTAHDPLTTLREQEFAYLAGPDVAAVLMDRGVVLG
jgi:hypothetical protein